MPIKKRSDDWERWNVPPEIRKKILEFARDQRRDPTTSEHMLWDAVRGRGVAGCKIRRQVPIGPFILDFYCPAHRLAIEIDGPIHLQQQERDAERQMLIEAPGIRFLRLKSGLVEHHMPEALNLISDALRPQS